MCIQLGGEWQEFKIRGAECGRGGASAEIKVEGRAGSEVKGFREIWVRKVPQIGCLEAEG